MRSSLRIAENAFGFALRSREQRTRLTIRRLTKGQGLALCGRAHTGRSVVGLCENSLTFLIGL